MRVIKVFYFLVLIMSVSSVNAASRGSTISVTDPETVAALLQTLEDSVWASDGEGDGKIAYAVYGTACGWSEKFFNDTRKSKADMQLRWIAAQGGSAGLVVENRDSDSVAKAFRQQRVSAVDRDTAQRAVAYNQSVIDAIRFQLGDLYTGPFELPTIIYETDTGLEILIGAPASNRSMIADIQPRPAKMTLKPKGVEIITEPLNVKETLQHYVNSSDRGIDLHSEPHESAPITSSLAVGYNLPASGVVEGSEWVEVLPYGNNGPKRYIHDPRLAEFSQIEFKVKKTGGFISASGEDLSVYAYPTKRSDVISTINDGYQTRKVGHTMIDGDRWDVISAYSDGSYGFVPTE